MKTKTKIVICFIAKILVVIIPFIILCIINWDEWFDFSKPQGFKISIGFGISLIVFMLCVFKAMGKCAPWVWALIIGVVFYLLEGIMKDIYIMAFVETIGLFVFSILNKVEKDFVTQAGYEKQAKINAKANYMVFKDNKTPEQLEQETGW